MASENGCNALGSAALLEVLQEYFTSSGDSTDQESDGSDESNDIEESIEAADADNQFEEQRRMTRTYVRPFL